MYCVRKKFHDQKKVIRYIFIKLHLARKSQLIN